MKSLTMAWFIFVQLFAASLCFSQGTSAAGFDLRSMPGITAAVQDAAGLTPVQPGGNPAALTYTSEVFIAFDDASTRDTTLKGIGSLASDLLRLRLISAMSGIIVHSGGLEQSCDSGQPGNDLAPPGTRKTTEKTRYYVSGTIEMLLGDSAVGLQYKVMKCTGSRSFLLIPPQHAEFPLERTVDQLNWLANYVQHRIQAEIPRDLVFVSECTFGDNTPDPALQLLADQIKVRIVDMLNGSAEYQSSNDPQDHTAVTCALVLKVPGRLAKLLLAEALKLKEATLEARISIKTSGREKPYEDPVSTLAKVGDMKNPVAAEKFAEEAAAKSIGALRFIRTAERLGVADRVDGWQADNYLAQGKKLLCVDSCSSSPDFQGALEALLRAKKLNSNSPEILSYLGQAQNGNRMYPDAKASLDEALNKLRPNQKKTMFEGDIYVFSGNSLVGMGAHADAADRYSRALDIFTPLQGTEERRIATYLKYSRALTQSAQRNKAAMAYMEALLTFPQSQELHRQAMNLIRRLSKSELDPIYAEFVDKGCTQQEIKNECAVLALQKAGQAAAGTGNPAVVRSFAEKALSFGPTDVQTRVEGLGFKFFAALDNDPNLTDRDLVEAENLLNRDLAPSVRDWIRRLRCDYWLQKGDFEHAYDAATLAVSEYPTGQDTRLAKAEAALGLAEVLKSKPGKARRRLDLLNEARELSEPLVSERYTSADNTLLLANHALQKDADSRDRFVQLLNKNPQDDSALQNALWVCTEWLFDFDCALKAARKSAAVGFRSKTPGIQLDLIEAAMLQGQDGDAEDWLKVINENPELPLDLRTVRDFYGVWLALKKKDPQTARLRFANWQDGLQRMRTKDKPQRIDWSFTGAKKVWGENRVPEASLYLEMIRSMEDPQAALPSFPQGS